MFKYLLGLFINLFNPAVPLLLRIDNVSKVDRRAKIFAFTQIFQSKVGAYTYVGRNTELINATLGKYCSIAPGCRIGLGSHSLDKLSTSPIFTQKCNAIGKSWTKHLESDLYKPIRIGNDVWIGEHAIIKSGVSIGDGAVVGTGAIVTHDVPPYAIVAGVPAKIIRYRFSEDQINKLENLKWWNMKEITLKANISLFQEKVNDNIIDGLENILKKQ